MAKIKAPITVSMVISDGYYVCRGVAAPMILSAEALFEPNENLFMPLLPGVQIVTLATTPRSLLVALGKFVGRKRGTEVLVEQDCYRVAWRGLWYLRQKADTWPNPLTIQATIEDGKGDMAELIRIQIQQTHAKKVRLAVRGNPQAMNSANRPPLAEYVNMAMRTWLAGFQTELQRVL